MAGQASAKARQNFSEILNQVAYAKERIVIERRGKELAVVIPIEDYRLLQEMEDRVDIADAKAAMQSAVKHGSVPWAEVKKKIKARKV